MQQQPNRWKGLICGMAGGAAGVTSMAYYWKAVKSITGQDPREVKKEGEAQTLDTISLLGKNHEDGESSTAAMGRHFYRILTGKDPGSEETRTILSYLFHWVFSIITGGIYGVARAGSAPPDLAGGAVFGISVWLFGDEISMPLMGMTDGPTAYPVKLHLYGAGAHLVYGLTTSITTCILYKIV